MKEADTSGETPGVEENVTGMGATGLPQPTSKHMPDSPIHQAIFPGTGPTDRRKPLGLVQGKSAGLRLVSRGMPLLLLHEAGLGRAQDLS